MSHARGAVSLAAGGLSGGGRPVARAAALGFGDGEWGAVARGLMSRDAGSAWCVSEREHVLAGWRHVAQARRQATAGGESVTPGARHVTQHRIM